jgi:putative redox protein
MTIEITFDGNKKISARMGDQIIRTDQPVKAGGEGTAPSPFDMFLASVGTCAGFYVKSFCDQRGISTDNIRIHQQLSWNHETKLFDRIDIEIEIPADFPENYREAMLRTADLCTVKKHLTHPPEIRVITKTVS